MGSNKLALHALRVTVMPKDIRLLRELWRYVAPDHTIARLSDSSIESLCRANAHDDVLKQRSRRGAVQRREALMALNQPVSKALEHFCGGLVRNRDGLWARSRTRDYKFGRT